MLWFWNSQKHRENPRTLLQTTSLIWWENRFTKFAACTCEPSGAKRKPELQTSSMDAWFQILAPTSPVLSLPDKLEAGCCFRARDLPLLVSSFLILSFSILDAVSVETQAYFNGTAYLPCPFTKAQNISLSELVVFWQDQQKLVLYEHYLGTEKLDSVNAKYLGRTSFDRNNWTLRLHNVQIKDMGSYDCFIQKKPPTGSIILQQTLTELSVIGMWSVLCLDCRLLRWDHDWAKKHWGWIFEQTGNEGRRESLLESPFGGNVGSESGELKALCTLTACFLEISENFLR